MSDGDVSDDDEALRRRVGDADVVRRAFDDLPVPAVVLEGPEHRFVAVNAGYRAMVGRQDIIGMPVREAFPELLGQQLFEAVDSIYASGEPYSMRGWRMHVTLEESGPQEIFLDVDFVPRRTADGTVQGILCTLRDVTQEVRQRLAAQEQAEVAERRFAQARDVIATLQRELLPRGLPVLPRVRIAGSYLLADADTAAGGDWFDALALPDGRVALVVGDVVGHGVAASAVMGQLRAVLAERLRAGVPIPDALAAVDAAAELTRGARAATVCVTVLDPADGTLSYCTAGHPPPLLVPAGGEPRYLPVTGAGPLGVGSRFPVGVARLDVGDVVLLYTDGIIERPGRETAASTVELAQVAADTVAGRALRTSETSPVERACTQTLEMLVRVSGHADDITLLAAQRTDPPPGLELTVPTEMAAVGSTRAALGEWLDEVGAADDDAFAVQHAVGELVTNAVEHAYGVEPKPDASVSLRGWLTPGGQVRIEVADRGSWRDADTGFNVVTAGRGRGLAMTRNLVDELHVDRRPDGTTAAITHRLTHPARLLTAEEILSGTRPVPPRTDETTLLLILDQPTSNGHAEGSGGDGGGAARIRVDGPVDAATAPQLHAELQRRRRGGTRGLIVDLTGVTHLASAGVAVLYQAARGGGSSAPLRLYAPPGSTAGHVLDLVALPHETRDPHLAPH